VDGFRADLPLPNINTLKVEPLIYKVAEIFDENNSLETYMARSQLTLKSHDSVSAPEAVTPEDPPNVLQIIAKTKKYNLTIRIASIFFKIIFAFIALVLLMLIASGKYNAYLSIGFLLTSCYLHLLAAPRSKIPKYIYFFYLIIIYELLRSGKVIGLLISVILPANFQTAIFGNMSHVSIILLALIYNSLPPLIIYLMLPATVLDDEKIE
jgi:hypothetical protein